jgi:transposase InsO family protein
VGTTHPSKNVMTTPRPLELPHIDLFGPVAYLSIGGSEYGLVIVDDYSRFTWVLFLQDKSETQETLKCFLWQAQNEFELMVKKIRSDNRSEFRNHQVEEHLEEEGIKHEFSAPYTPQQNGVVERMNQMLIDMARTMLGEYKMLEWLSHPFLVGKPNANHVRARIRNSCTQRLHNWTLSHMLK